MLDGFEKTHPNKESFLGLEEEEDEEKMFHLLTCRWSTSLSVLNDLWKNLVFISWSGDLMMRSPTPEPDDLEAQ